VLRASAACEKAGFPTSSLVCEGFLGQAAATSIGLGFPTLPVAMIPGHAGVQSETELRGNVQAVTAEQVIENLTRGGKDESLAVTLSDEPGPRDVVFNGTFEEVNEYFIDKEWSDGLPIVPPTIEKVQEFLSWTDRDPSESLGTMLPASRAATIWATAVNGVMAGCRPEYMPILVALIEAMANEAYGVEHSGNTPGAETLIVLNGPIIKELDFNYTQGVLRDGFRPNTSVGRFWRLALRNMAGFLLHKTDKATYGNTFRVVLPENEDIISEIGWAPHSVEGGFEAGDNTVSVARMTGGTVVPSVSGSTPEEMMPYVADAVAKVVGWELIFTVGSVTFGTLRPALILSPILAQRIAAAGWSKDDVKQYLFDHARLPASKVEAYTVWTNHPIGSLEKQVGLGRIPPVFAQSKDPDRLVPIVFTPDDFIVLVSGDVLRTNAYTFCSNGYLGFPTTAGIDLPANWEARLHAKGDD
jgi:hypothetical protein